METETGNLNEKARSQKSGGRRVGSTNDSVTNINGSKIRELRVEKDWSQEVLGRKADLSKGTVSQTESRPNFRVSRRSFSRLATALEVDPADLILVQEPIKSTPELLDDALKTLTSSLRRSELLQESVARNIVEIRSLIGVITELRAEEG
jgi:transcriptional regulator with XRE-family HTH domain